MLILYFKPTCPFSRYVIDVAKRLSITLELRDISSDESYAIELIERGGKRQTPYLVDVHSGVELYDSNAIISHLQKIYGS